MRVAIIGTRDVVLGHPLYEMLAEWSRILLEKGIIVTTGAADGVDDAAMEGARRVKDPELKKNLHVYLPWSSYNRNRVPSEATITVYNPSIHKTWTDSVYKYHDAPDRLSRGGWALMSRNYGIVADPPVDVVIALPKNLNNWGGTGEGMRIANGLGIKLFNLREDGGVNDAATWIDEL